MKIMKNKKAVAFLSGSAGELDWILPILDHLSNLQFEIKIIYLTRHVKKSVNHNSLLRNYIIKPENQIEAISTGDPFVEMIERIGYLAHRINIKLKKPKLLSVFFYIIEYACRKVFEINLPKHLLSNQGERTLIFTESPSLRRPRDKWIKEIFNQSIFFYCPHSPHIYTSDLDREYPLSNDFDFNKKYFLLMGHPADYFEIDEENEFTSSDLEKVFTGHPKYSRRWLKKYKEKANSFRSSIAEREETNILVISRGYGSYIDEESQKDLIEATVQVVDKHLSHYNLFVKKHPRETDSHWDKIADSYPSIKIIEEHILDIACKVDFAITFWSSGAMDCATLEVPVIEFYDPNKHPKQQIPQEDSFTTIYRKLGLVYAANDKNEFEKIVSSLITKDSNISSERPHAFYNDLMDRSNLWEEKIEKILNVNNLL